MHNHRIKTISNELKTINATKVLSKITKEIQNHKTFMKFCLKK